LRADGINEWSPAFLKLSTTLDGCAKHYERFCKNYRHKSKGGSRCHWGSRMLKRLVETNRSARSKKNLISPGQQQLPWDWDVRLNHIPEDWHQVAVKFLRINGIRDSYLQFSLFRIAGLLAFRNIQGRKQDAKHLIPYRNDNNYPFIF